MFRRKVLNEWIKIRENGKLITFKLLFEYMI